MKFYVIINKKIPTGNAINIASHMMTGLVATADKPLIDEMQVINYGFENHNHRASKWPQIILKAKNSNQIKKVLSEVTTLGLHHVTFTSTMIEGGWQVQVKNTQALSDEEIEYMGLAVFCDSNALDSTTKKLSLYQ